MLDKSERMTQTQWAGFKKDIWNLLYLCGHLYIHCAKREAQYKREHPDNEEKTDEYYKQFEVDWKSCMNVTSYELPLYPVEMLPDPEGTEGDCLLVPFEFFCNHHFQFYLKEAIKGMEFFGFHQQPKVLQDRVRKAIDNIDEGGQRKHAARELYEYVNFLILQWSPNLANYRKQAKDMDLSDNQNDLYMAACEICTDSKNNKTKGEEIAKQAFGDFATFESYKKDLSKLVKLGLLKSSSGRGNGYWLPDSGPNSTETS